MNENHVLNARKLEKFQFIILKLIFVNIKVILQLW